jgi:hypothetical protein
MRRKKNWKSSDFFCVPIVFECPERAMRYSKRMIVKSVAFSVDGKCWLLNPVDAPKMKKAGYMMLDEHIVSLMHEP